MERYLKCDVSNVLVRKRLRPKKILDKKNEQRYTLTVLKALKSLDFVGKAHGVVVNRRDSVLDPFKEREQSIGGSFIEEYGLLESKH